MNTTPSTAAPIRAAPATAADAMPANPTPITPPPGATGPLPARIPVLIAGGGPVGLTAAALLARYGVPSLVIEADDGYCSGSRATCISRRSQEVLSWAGADRALVDKGLGWVSGRSFFRGTEILHFHMPSEATERYAPMVNIQQYYVEQFAHLAGLDQPAPIDVRWSHRVLTVQSFDDYALVDVRAPDGTRQTVRCDWLVACDGGRSTVREQLGLQFEGVQYDGRYVIVDIEQVTERRTERLAWFDPPTNPGSTILMHRQPDNVWRVDYQLRDDEDPVEAIKPHNVLPRVQSHLTMIGESAPWKPLWISIYNAKCLTLPSYRRQRVLFAGDAAHMVPIFGVRGLNSGIDDAGNLAWKLALALSGRADPSLLDSYSIERVAAARENIAYGAKSTEFMSPPNYGFDLMRQAALRLALEDPSVRSLVNPRQTTPIAYAGSPLNVGAAGGAIDTGCSAAASPGAPAPEALMTEAAGPVHLSRLFGAGFVALLFSDHDDPALVRPLQAVSASLVPSASHASPAADPGPARLDVWRIARTGPPDGKPPAGVLIDTAGQAWSRYEAQEGTLVLVRPDGYLLRRWPTADAAALASALQPFFQTGVPA